VRAAGKREPHAARPVAAHPASPTVQLHHIQKKKSKKQKRKQHLFMVANGDHSGVAFFLKIKIERLIFRIENSVSVE
jgi:hypothetical protein